MSDDPTDALTALAEQLEALAAHRAPLYAVDLALRKRVLEAAGRLSRPDPKETRVFNRAKRRARVRARRAADRAVLDTVGIRKLRENPIFQTPRRLGEAPAEPPPAELHEPQSCYVCKEKYTVVHHFYDQMCPSCGDRNWEKRSQTADLTGRVALLTGGRVKIGYQIGIKLLRAGAHLVVVTRFPADAARRYAAEEDFAAWGDRLTIHGIDLRHTPSVELLCQRLLVELPRLDVLIHNACQTVRRPPGFYGHLIEGERQIGEVEAALVAPARELDGVTRSAALTQVPLLPEDLQADPHLFPAGQLDADLQQVDLREVNSWRLKLAEVPTIELLEVQLVNAVAPFVMSARLKPLMLRVPTNDAHIVNVSAMEGQFYRTYKSDRHPHTNMAKAALNMLTRTSAADYAADGIYMNSVDTGWVTDEDPAAKAEEKREMHDFHPPLDIVDGAARVLDPVFVGHNTGEHQWGLFLKDYAPTDW
jgi:NAD(P)-dependent dehydrogenase (short-subunit alcohol dehydrogenase family)/predicted RNA-binding Zn-ribbon protein involved in translation (DUF1610 family)